MKRFMPLNKWTVLTRHVPFYLLLALLVACSDSTGSQAEQPGEATAEVTPVTYEAGEFGMTLTIEKPLGGGSTVQLTYIAMVVEETRHKTVTIAVDLDNEPLLDLRTTTGQNGDLQLEAVYGEGFHNIQQAELVVEDDLIQGRIDGREILPFPKDDPPPDTLAFVDQGPSLSIQVDPKAQRALELILAELQSSKVQELLLQVGADSGQRSYRNGGSNDHGHDSDTVGTVDCGKCWAACITAGVSCLVGGLGGCSPLLAIPFAGPALYATCAAVTAVACTAVEVVCMDACYDPGAGCCPVHCGGAKTACCLEGETCLNNNGVCCSPGKTPCAGTSCCGDGETCISSGAETGTCCDQASLCGQACCDTDSVCTNPSANECCASDKACGAVCCGANEDCIDPQQDLCCDVMSIACNGQCCPFGSSCINGACCSQGSECGSTCCGSNEVCCGSVCCASGYECVDPNTSTCSQCPTGQSGCPGGGCCDTGWVCQGGPNVDDGSRCCPPGHLYCFGACRPYNDCVH